MKHLGSFKKLLAVFFIAIICWEYSLDALEDVVALEAASTVSTEVATRILGETAGPEFIGELATDLEKTFGSNALQNLDPAMVDRFVSNIQTAMPEEVLPIPTQEELTKHMQTAMQDMGLTSNEKTLIQNNFSENFLKTADIAGIPEKGPALPKNITDLESELGVQSTHSENLINAKKEVNLAQRDLAAAEQGKNLFAIEEAESKLNAAQTKLNEVHAEERVEIAKMKEGLGKTIRATQAEISELETKIGAMEPSDSEYNNLQRELGQKAENLKNFQAKAEIAQQADTQAAYKEAKTQLDQARENLENLKTQRTEVIDQLKTMDAKAAGRPELEAKLERLKSQIEHAEGTIKDLDIARRQQFNMLAQTNNATFIDRLQYTYDNMTWGSAAEKGFSVLKGGMSLIMIGLVFSLGSYITGSIQEALIASTRHAALKLPQRFGDIWMQIPGGLLTKKDQPMPESSIFLYVGLEVEPEKTSVDRVGHADTDEYLKIAPIFIPASKYDEWASSPITDPRMSYMVHANTGYHFVSGGQPVPGEEIIRWLGPTERSGMSLQSHLDELEGTVSHGYEGKTVYTYRQVSVSYPGEPVIGGRFDPGQNKPFVQDLYPGFAQEGESWGSILNNSMKAIYNGMEFDGMKARPIRALDDATLKAIGAQDSIPDKPYFAFGTYVYESPDTPNIQSLKKNPSPSIANIADKLVEYVIFVDDENNPVPLEMPTRRPPYNFPGFTLNLKANKMLSLFDGTFYEEGSKTSPSGLDVGKILSNYFSQGVEQINAMRDFVMEQLKYGPFSVGDVSLTIDKKLQDQGVPVYMVAKRLEDGGNDYVVPTMGMSVANLPGSPSNFVSLVTSRIYGPTMIPYDKAHAGKKDMAYTVYKVSDDKPPRVVVGGAQSNKYGKVIAQGTAPLYSLFMDPDVNPNTIDEKAVPNKADAQWLAGKLGRLKNGVIQWPLPMPVPNQWALSDHGPTIQVGNRASRIGNFLSEKAPDLKKSIDTVHTNWKKNMITKSPEDIERDLGIFAWSSTALRTINIRVTSAEDVKRGNFIYTSPYYPGEYLVLAKNKEGTEELGKEFNIAEPQQYLISLSTGNVYDRAADGEPVAHVDAHELFNRVKQVQPTMSATLVKAIESSQVGSPAAVKDPYGTTVEFGPFTFYLFKTDADRGQYVYADVSDIKNYREKAQKGTLLNEIKHFYVAIELKKGVTDQNNPANWLFGRALGAKTLLILNLVNGILNGRDGSYQGYFKPFSHSITNNLDIKQGYIDLVFNYLKATWQQEAKQAELRSELKNRIVALTQDYYDLLLKQKGEIEEAEKEEGRLRQPLDANLLANIKAQPYFEAAERFGRHIKKYDDKFYAVDPNNSTITDFNVGDPKKDNNVGTVYDGSGNFVLNIYNWVLNAARAFNGIFVNPDGTQEFDVMINHPAIPMKGMIKLAFNDIKARYEKAEKALQAARAALIKNSSDITVQTKFSEAAVDLANAKRLYVSSQSVEGISGYEFYFNEEIGIFFVKNGQRYIDLQHGYTFNLDGSVRLLMLPVLMSDQPSKDQLFVGVDEVGAYVAEFKGNRKGYSRLFMTNQGTDEKGNIRYVMADSGIEELPLEESGAGDEYYIDYDQNKNQYTVSKVSDVGKVQKVGTYSPAPKLVAGEVMYMNTNGVEKGKYVKEDAGHLSATYIIWNGGPRLELQKIYYRRHLISLKKQGDSYTGTYQKDKTTQTITVKEQSVTHGKIVTGHYLSITDGGKTYNFMYMAGILDISDPTSCAKKDQKGAELTHLGMARQCMWEIGVIPTAYGINNIVKSLPKRLPGVPAEDTERVGQQAGDRKQIAQANLALIMYDKKYNRYVYQLGSRDAGWPYYHEEINGWYIDLKTGIIYDPKAPSSGAYPYATLLLSQLFILLDKLEVSVSSVQRKDGTVGDGLVYRSPQVVAEEKGKMVILNQQIYDLAKT